MAKKPGRPSKGRDDVTVKLDRIIAGRAKTMATDKGVTAAEFLSDLIRPVVDREWGKYVKKMDRDKPKGD